MDSRPSSSTYDQDLDAPRRRSPEWNEPFADYQRLIVNPLLAVASVVAAVLFIRISLQHRSLALFLAAIGLLGGAIFFTQFHCLDCGATGWLLTARRHACSTAVTRWREGRRARWRLPGLKAQILLWLHFLAAVTALILILFAISR